MLVVVALSGGVDSSVAAALLRAEGHEVVGVTMQIWPEEEAGRAERHGGCCAQGAVRDARAVAETLGIPYYVFQMRAEFEREVIGRFIQAYASGRTPNPCIACNEFIKFRALLAKARRMGAGALATGHYARLRQGPDGWELWRGADARKDQSYVLHPLDPEDLAFLRFPTGEFTKEETRAWARRLGLPTADKPDSQEICFVGEAGYAEVVGRARPEALRPGPILDLDGRVLGQHAGLARYTVGQRRGLGLASGRPLFVVALDPERNALIVGEEADTAVAWCTLPRPHWLAPVPAAGMAVTAKVRSGPALHPAACALGEGGALTVRFTPPVRAVTPGQSCVLYLGERVLGGGEIDRVGRLAADRAALATAAP